MPSFGEIMKTFNFKKETTSGCRLLEVSKSWEVSFLSFSLRTDFLSSIVRSINLTDDYKMSSNSFICTFLTKNNYFDSFQAEAFF